MSLDTYDNLKQEIIDWGHRDDIDLKVDTFIDLAEFEMFNNPQQVLKVRGQQARSTATVDTTTRYLALPDNFQSMRRLRLELNNCSSEVKFRTPEQLSIKFVDGRPSFFTVTTQLEFDQIPDAQYIAEMQYWEKPIPLSSNNQTNSVLESDPNIYLFGSLWALNEFADEEVKAAKYYSRFITAITGANKQFKRGRYGPSPTPRIIGSTP